MSAGSPKILVIDDNPDFGGHQVMAAYGLEALLQFGDWEVLALLHPENKKNRQRWSAIAEGFGKGRLRISEAPTRTAKFQAIRRHFQKSRVLQLLGIVQQERPDLVLVIQGNIEQCSSAFQLKGKIDCPIVSYIPVPHKHAEMGAKLGVLRDLTCRGLYGEPDGLIIISGTLGQMLRDYGALGRIQVVENGIPLEGFKAQPSRREAREQFNLPQEVYLWGQIGRSEFKQKGQDFALQLFLERAAQNSDEHMVFLGSGPDSEALEAAASGHSNVHCLPWTDKPAPLYAALDAMIMPSRYEGVPLAMLEALANGVPVAATDRDGMCDWLPEAWRFAYRDAESGLDAMKSVRNAEASVVDALKQRVWDSHSVEDFQRAFNAALEEWL
ncbi:MAG: glycosyltransferase family 4 protein [Verrucomicrobiota bacterium]